MNVDQEGVAFFFFFFFFFNFDKFDYQRTVTTGDESMLFDYFACFQKT